jgi:hypothetical protein
MTVISAIIGSTREGRFSEKPAKWILQHLKKRERVDARLLDLRDFPMPFFDQVAIPVATLWAHYQGGDVEGGLAELEAPAGTFIDDLLWWTAALKTARASAS